MTEPSLTGYVVVVAVGSGDDALAVGRALLRSGALVGLVTPDNAAVDTLERESAAAGIDPPFAFRSDPTDTTAWLRVAPQLEQRLGPVDAVVTDNTSRPVVEPVFSADLRRRGRGEIVDIDVDDVVTAVSRSIHRTP